MIPFKFTNKYKKIERAFEMLSWTQEQGLDKMVPWKNVSGLGVRPLGNEPVYNFFIFKIYLFSLKN